MFTGQSRRPGPVYQEQQQRNNVVEKVPLKGLFSDGVWKCNCEPRLPAPRFQTKKEGPNHGRWFYKCPKQRCNFFLWDDDARPREMAAASSNSNTEPPVHAAPPQTPRTNRAQGPLMTPEDSHEKSAPSFRIPQTTTTPYTPSKSTGQYVPLRAGSPDGAAAAQDDDNDPNEQYFDADPGAEEEFFQSAVPRASIRAMPPPETPRKAAKNGTFPTPGKRNYDEMAHDEKARDEPTVATQLASSPATLLQDGDVFTTQPASSAATFLQDGDVFTTPSAATAPRAPNLFSSGSGDPPSVTDTGVTQRFHDPLTPGSGQDSALATELLSFLTMDNASREVKDRIRAVANRHSRHTYGVTLGRERSRAQILQEKKTIAKLEGDIAALQAERDTNRAVIGLLTRELETAKDKGGR
ncbi:hypothetical protein MMC07_008264 [Pseudocyphellaria aurata]|nr:hypothetical protein [Pseudocyphellaria aurata]